MKLPRIVLVVLALMVAPPVAAQTWPSRPVSIVVGFLPGTGPDIIARFVAERLHERTGQQFIVENKPGAFSMVGAQAVARAAPDGYTLLLSTVSAAMNVHLFRKLNYDHARDFTPVTTLANAAFVLLVNPDVVPVASVAELTEYIRARPDKIAYGSGTAGNVAAAFYLSLSGLQRERLIFIPYKGGTDALHDLRGGRIHFSFFDSTFGIQQAQGAKLRALAITSTKRTSAAPDIPTMAEAGLPNYDLVGWYAVFLPAKAPKDITHKLAELCNAAMASEKGREFLRTLAMDPNPGSPEHFAQFLDSETAKWGRLIRDAGIEPQ
jgi:tripartite-type tricarboxylate transporter receptor subunit TctC